MCRASAEVQRGGEGDVEKHAAAVKRAKTELAQRDAAVRQLQAELEKAS